tara:strand:- start:32 stop:823 length:792 start_codon:yes stop_codon:yes gene_type:complete
MSLEGEDSSEFLQNLITNDINLSRNNNILYSCLLTPQGKFISDFFIFKLKEKFVIETHSFFYEKLLQKLNLYKLRSKILINEINYMNSYSIFGELQKDEGVIFLFSDPRNKNIGSKLIHESQNPEILNDFVEIDENKYHEILIKNTVPLSHHDLEENKSLLLENNFDNLNSISWDKGCYVGQELTARMKYRALLKKRIYSLTLKKGSPKSKQPIKENGNEIGKIISVKNKSLLAMLKIEVAETKIQSRETIKTIDGLILDFVI